MALSEVSLYLLKRRETVQELLAAERQLHEQFTDILENMIASLRNRPTFEGGTWEAVWHSDEQIYVAKKTWGSKEGYPVWIGVEGFTPDALFGSAPPATLYVWVAKKRLGLVRTLTNLIEESQCRMIGEFDRRSTGYVIRQAVPKYLPDEAGDFEAPAGKLMADFIGHWAEVIGQYDDVIREGAAL